MSSLAWFFTHVEDVRSDMSVFHRIDDIEAVPVSRLVPLMVRLPIYDGAVAFAVRHEPTEPARKVDPPRPQPAVALSSDQLQAMNRNALYGPLPTAGQHVGLFEVSKVPAA